MLIRHVNLSYFSDPETDPWVLDRIRLQFHGRGQRERERLGAERDRRAVQQHLPVSHGGRDDDRSAELGAVQGRHGAGVLDEARPRAERGRPAPDPAQQLPAQEQRHGRERRQAGHEPVGRRTGIPGQDHRAPKARARAARPELQRRRWRRRQRRRRPGIRGGIIGVRLANGPPLIPPPTQTTLEDHRNVRIPGFSRAVRPRHAIHN